MLSFGRSICKLNHIICSPFFVAINSAENLILLKPKYIIQMNIIKGSVLEHHLQFALVAKSK